MPINKLGIVETLNLRLEPPNYVIFFNPNQFFLFSLMQ